MCGDEGLDAAIFLMSGFMSTAAWELPASGARGSLFHGLSSSLFRCCSTNRYCLGGVVNGGAEA